MLLHGHVRRKRRTGNLELELELELAMVVCCLLFIIFMIALFEISKKSIVKLQSTVIFWRASEHRTVPTIQVTPRSSYSRKGTSPSTDINHAFGSGKFRGLANGEGATVYACRISRLRVAFFSIIIVFLSSPQPSMSLSDSTLLSVVR